MQLEEATFLTDDLDIRLVSDKGILEDSITKMGEKVAKYLYRKLNIKQIKRDIINGNNYYGLYATFIDKFDEKTNRPVLKGIDPLSPVSYTHLTLTTTEPVSISLWTPNH